MVRPIVGQIIQEHTDQPKVAKHYIIPREDIKFYYTHQRYLTVRGEGLHKSSGFEVSSRLSLQTSGKFG